MAHAGPASVTGSMTRQRASEWLRGSPAANLSVQENRGGLLPLNGILRIDDPWLTFSLGTKQAAAAVGVSEDIVVLELNKDLLPKATSCANSRIGFSNGRCHLTIGRGNPYFAELSGLLLNGGAIPLRIEGHGLVLVPVSHSYASSPPAARDILIQHLPPSMSLEDTPEIILKAAGYQVLHPPTLQCPSPPPPGSVYVLRLRLGKTNLGFPNASVMVVTVLPPSCDPDLLQLPPHFSLPGWGERILTLMWKDGVRRTSQGADPPVVLPSFLGEGFQDMDLGPEDFFFFFKHR